MNIICNAIFRAPRVKNYLIFLILLAFACGAGPALAEVADPFAVQEDQDWVSLDKYDQQLAATAHKMQSEAAAEQAKSADQTQNHSELAQPQRPLQLPVMPLAASTTTASPSGGGYNVESSLRLEERKWVEAREALRSGDLGQAANDTKTPVSIRFPVLPGSKVQSIAAPRISQSKLTREARAEAAQALADGKNLAREKDPPRAAKEKNNACEAYAEFRRRQLQAIETDRATLAQLKGVLVELGLVDKLSFMNDSIEITPTSVSESTTASNATAPSDVRMP